MMFTVVFSSDRCKSKVSEHIFKSYKKTILVAWYPCRLVSGAVGLVGYCFIASIESALSFRHAHDI